MLTERGVRIPSMSRLPMNHLRVVSLCLLLAAPPSTKAESIFTFLKALSHSITHPHDRSARRAALFPQSGASDRRDLPYGIAVPRKPGFVISPFSPKHGYVDVRGFPRGTEVKDPYTDKVFLTP